MLIVDYTSCYREEFDHGFLIMRIRFLLWDSWKNEKKRNG